MQAHRKTLLFRQVNDTIDDLLHRFGAEDDATFFCECPAAMCSRRLALTPAQFDEIRRRGAFVVAPECAVGADIVEEGDAYVVVSSFRMRLRATLAAA